MAAKMAVSSAPLWLLVLLGVSLHVSCVEPTNSKSSLGLIIGFVVAALVLACAIAGIVVFFKRRQDDYKAAPTSDKGSNSSDQGSHQTV